MRHGEVLHLLILPGEGGWLCTATEEPVQKINCCLAIFWAVSSSAAPRGLCLSSLRVSLPRRRDRDSGCCVHPTPRLEVPLQTSPAEKCQWCFCSVCAIPLLVSVLFFFLSVVTSPFPLPLSLIIRHKSKWCAVLSASGRVSVCGWALSRLRSVCALWGNKLDYISVYLIVGRAGCPHYWWRRVRGGSADGKEGGGGRISGLQAKKVN